MTESERHLVENIGRFVGFARKRLNDPHLAEDVVQESLLKALKAENKPSDEEDVIAWFYKILRRSIIDVYRRNGAKDRNLAEFSASFPSELNPEEKNEVCGCLTGLLPELAPQYREVLEKIDLAGAPIKTVAEELGVSSNNLTVRLHRARKQLKEKVEDLCRTCATHGCVDCNCEPSASEAETCSKYSV